MFPLVEEITLPPEKSVTLVSFYGNADDIMDVPDIARQIIAPGFVRYKLLRAQAIINQITSGIETKTTNDLFDGHLQQMYLDNSLRGGFPIILGERDDNAFMSTADEDQRLKVGLEGVQYICWFLLGVMLWTQSV